MKSKLPILAISLTLVVTLAVAGTETFFEVGITEQKAYATLCPNGYHWDDDANKCISD